MPAGQVIIKQFIDGADGPQNIAYWSDDGTPTGNLSPIVQATGVSVGGGGTGDASAAKQDIGNASLGSIDGKLPASLGAKASNASLSVAPATDAVFVADTVIRAAPANRGATVGTTAVTLAAANPSRRGFAIQNQSTTASCYVSTIGTATADFNALWIGPGAYYETPPTHTGTGAISVICTAAGTAVYAREW